MNHHPHNEWIAEFATLGAPELAVMARSMIATRRALHGPLPSELVHDPILDLLLYLFVAKTEGRQISCDELMGKTSTSPGVTKRWIAVLEERGYVSVNDDAVILSVDGLETVEATLHAVANSQWHLDEI